MLLLSSHTALLTAAAEGIRQLGHPLQLLHTYIPVLPSSLVDYLEAPTPFLMGLTSGVSLDPGLVAQLTVVDLDRCVGVISCFSIGSMLLQVAAQLTVVEGDRCVGGKLCSGQ